MTRQGASGPVRISRGNASVAEQIIRERTRDADVEGSPFAELHGFARKLGAALKRRRSGSNKLVLWNLTPKEVESGYRYLMSFSHSDVPSDYLTVPEFDSVHDVALDLLEALLRRRGRPGLSRAEVEKRIDAMEHHLTAQTTDAPDDRFVRRLKKQLGLEDAYWASHTRRRPLAPGALALLAPRRNTGI